MNGIDFLELETIEIISNEVVKKMQSGMCCTSALSQCEAEYGIDLQRIKRMNGKDYRELICEIFLKLNIAGLNKYNSSL